MKLLCKFSFVAYFLSWSIYSFAQITQIAKDTIPFELTKGNNIKVKAVLNGTDTLDFYFDSGGTELVMTHEAIANRTHLLEKEVEGYTTQTYEPLSHKSSLQIGKNVWEDMSIYPARVSPKGTDGHFGWDLFKDKIVELDYDHQRMIIHTTMNTISPKYEKFEIEYINTLFCIQAVLVVKGKKYENRYLFDTGYQRAILLDKTLRKKDNFPTNLPALKTTKLKNGAGKVFITKIINANKIRFGKYKAPNVPAQLLTTANPARFETHILGNELLKRFNTILDFQNGFVYLKPNTLIKVPYIDAS